MILLLDSSVLSTTLNTNACSTACSSPAVSSDRFSCAVIIIFKLILVENKRSGQNDIKVTASYFMTLP